MPATRIFRTDATTLPSTIDFQAIRDALGIPGDFPAAVPAEAEQIVAQPPALQAPGVLDVRDIPFVTIDPSGSLDLDQAVHLEDLGGGCHRVRYAIADLGLAIPPGGALEQESLLRGQTFYSPDRRDPLYPATISEGAGSLLADQERRAVLWTIDLDDRGLPTASSVVRCAMKSVARLDYLGVQATFDSGAGIHPSIAALKTVGEQRLAAARARHAITLALPDVEVEQTPEDGYVLHLRGMTPVEQWNAEISLLTGMAAAQMMLEAGRGLVRILPAPDERAVRRLRAESQALGIDWPEGASPGEVVAGLVSTRPGDAAFLADAVMLLRGAGYRAFSGGAPAADEVFHAGVGAPYAHVTAPLRRLVDRFATEFCLAHATSSPVPSWVGDQVDAVVETMQRTDHQAHALDRRGVAAVAGAVLAQRIGSEIDGVVIQVDEDRHRASITLADPPVQARCAANGLTEGTKVRVRVVSVLNDVITVQPVG